MSKIYQEWADMRDRYLCTKARICLQIKGAETLKCHADVFITALIPEKSMRVSPHGIIGQSFDRDNIAKNGKTDVYPLKGYFKTSALAEGAIEGDASMYIVDGAYDTHFKYSKFESHD